MSNERYKDICNIRKPQTKKGILYLAVSTPSRTVVCIINNDSLVMCFVMKRVRGSVDLNTPVVRSD